MNFIENGDKSNTNPMEQFEKTLNNVDAPGVAEKVDFGSKSGIMVLINKGYTPDYLKNNSDTLIKSIESTISQTESKDELRAYEMLISDIRAAGVNFSIKPINDKISEQKKQFITNDMSGNKFYNNVFDSYLQTVYKKDIGDMGLFAYIKKNFPLENAKSTISTYFDNGLKTPFDKGGFSNVKVQQIFDEQYGKSIDQLVIPGVDILELGFKRNELQKKMHATIDSYLSKYSIEPGYKNDFTSELQDKYGKILVKSSSEDIVKEYNRSKNGLKLSFDTEIKDYILEQMTDYNRDYLSGQMKNITEDSKFIKHFDNMLDNSSSKTVNTFSEALNYPGQNPKILQEIKTKIESRGDFKNSFRFTNGMITDTEISDSGSKYKYETIIRPKETIKSINVAATKSYLDTLASKSADISSINVTLPVNNPLAYQQMEDIIPNSIKEKISFVDGTDDNNIKFDIMETREVSDKISLKLNKLDANIIGNYNSIYDVLSQDPAMKKVIDDPNYKIVGGNISGTASRNPTNYESTFTNDSPIQKWLNSYNPPINSSDKNITNNPSLAFDRAASFLDFFTSIPNKVSPTSRFNINYNVDGKSKSELTNDLTDKLQRKPTQAEMLEGFKERQNASINLSLLKKENNTSSETIALDQEEKVASFSLSILSEASSTAGSGTGSSTNKLRVRGNGLVNGGKIPKNPVKCFKF